MRRRLLDASLVAAAGLAILAAVFFGARESLEGPKPTAGLRERVASPHGPLVKASRDMRASIDPYNPPGLPAGVTVDRTTGLMVGLDLAAGKDEATPGWTLLSLGNDAQGVADLPAQVRALDGHEVVMAGFMMALYALRDIHEFALVGSHTKCCFGVPPGVGDQVVVTLRRGGPSTEMTLAPVRVAGTFRIRPQHLYEDGHGPLIWLYEIVDARVVAYDG